MACQKCRQPLRLDGSLENLNPAAYDLLISTTSHQFSQRSPDTRSPFLQSQEQARKHFYDRVAQNANQPTFKKHHGSNPRDATMSFVYLTESQVGHPQTYLREPASTQPKSSKSSSAPDATVDSQQVAESDETKRMSRLFDILSSKSDIDHPVCVECTDLLIEGLQRKLDASVKERDAYVKYLRQVKTECPSEEDVKLRQESLVQAEKAREAAIEELKKLEEEKDALDEEIIALEEESRILDKEEEIFWKERNDFDARLADFQSERDSINDKYSHDSQLLEKLQRSNVYNDTFCISHDGSFATINGLRLGRLSNKPVDWPEINAAWGHALLLLVTVAEKLNYKFSGYDPQPMGSTSKIIRYDMPSPSSSRSGGRTMQAPPKKHVLELYSSGDMPLGLTFMHRKFDNAMVAFLEMVRQLGTHVQEQTERSANALSLPYKIEGDKISDVSIKLGIAQDDGWTKACKLTLTCCKFLLAHASNASSVKTTDA